MRFIDRLHPLALGSIALVFVLAFGIWGELSRSGAERDSSGLPQGNIQKRGDVVAYGWTESKRVGDRPVKVWITAENKGAESITDLRVVDFHFMRLERAGTCWSRTAPHYVPVCLRKGRRVADQGVTLAAGEATTFQAEIQATPGAVGSYDPAAILEWRNHKKQRIQLGVPVGPVQVGKGKGSWARAVFAVLKDTLLPAALLALGWLFQQHSDRLEQERQEAEKKRERKRQEADRERAAIQETWHIMLPHIHDYMKSYYMPIQQALLELEDEFEEWEARGRLTSKKETGTLFFYYMLFLKRMSILLRGPAGFFFKNPLGEKLAELSWEFFLRGQYATLDRSKVQEAVPKMEANEILAEFRKRSADPSPFSTVHGQFQDLLEAGVDWQRQMITVFHEVLKIEASRPYELWYSPTPDRASFGDLDRVKRTLSVIRDLKDAEVQRWTKPVYETAGTDSEAAADYAAELDELIEDFVRKAEEYLNQNSPLGDQEDP